MAGIKREYKDFWSITWQDINRRKDRYRNELFIALSTLYERNGLTMQDAMKEAKAHLEELDQSLAKDAARDAEYWETQK